MTKECSSAPSCSRFPENCNVQGQEHLCGSCLWFVFLLFLYYMAVFVWHCTGQGWKGIENFLLARRWAAVPVLSVREEGG